MIFSIFTVLDNIRYYYKKYTKLTELVSIHYTGRFNNRFTIFISSLYIILVNILRSLDIFRLPEYPVKLDKNKYLVSYTINNKTYKLTVNIKNGPKRISRILGHDGHDITSDILPYLGPEENFHNILYTPRFFEKKCIIFQLSDGSVCEFIGDEIIII
jgi:hypothetical protein